MFTVAFLVFRNIEGKYYDGEREQRWGGGARRERKRGKERKRLREKRNGDRQTDRQTDR